ncbi:MAG: PilX N-terminal domain-containing pilus assembly protein [Pseudomonadota bacterium]
MKNTISKQRGAALVVGLVVLLMLTLLGVSSMNMTSLELRISGNTQNRNIVFQVADSVNDLIFSATGNNTNVFDYTTSNPQTFNNATGITNGGNSITVNTATTGQFMGSASAIQCPGNSLTLSCNSYELDSVSTFTNTNASARVVQGFVKPGPSLEN